MKDEYDNNKYQMLANKNVSGKQWWTLIKPVHKSNELAESIPQIDTGGEILVDDRDKARAFNSYLQKASLLDDSNAEVPIDRVFLNMGYTILILPCRMSLTSYKS